MIYLIGGPPRAGKTTLAKALAKKLRISWISTDTLEVVSREYIPKSQWKKLHPYSHLRGKGKARNNDEFYEIYSASKIIQVLKVQAKSVYKAIDTMIANEIDNGNDYIIEGYHLAPEFVHKLIKTHGKKNIRTISLTKFDPKKFAIDVHRSKTPNDWLLVLTKKEETFLKVGNMVAKFSHFFEKGAKKYGFSTLNMDHNFTTQIKRGINLLTKK
ncbi:AAA family ATPase [Patescibacteria group bacterium]|nr:AAA family ATPase [Patescibacteria group bacterium]MBU1682663.1 AAA family ATPase [Patescibacteria group bacterium]MBU1935190.1 AAA family ATPase [Patescibacteria group bacterium]